MPQIVATDHNVSFAQSDTPVDLTTAHTVINGRGHWLLIGENWWQMGAHNMAKPNVDHPLDVIEFRGFDIPTLLRTSSIPPDLWCGIRISRSEVQG